MGVRKLLILGVLLTSLYAFQHGGNANQPLPPLPSVGDVYAYTGGGTTYVSPSNVVQVQALSILSVTTNFIRVNPGDVFTVTMTVRNTGTTVATLTSAQIRFYSQAFTAALPTTYELPSNMFTGQSWVGSLILAGGATDNLVFTVIATTNTSVFDLGRSSTVVVDGQLNPGPTGLFDRYWTNTAIDAGVYQYAALSTGNIDTSGPPVVQSLNVSPNPSGPGTLTVTFNFSRAMDIAQPPDVYFVVNTVTHPLLTGAWSGNQSWVCTYTIPAGSPGVWDGTAVVGITRATDNYGVTVNPSANIGNFVIDTTIPTASIAMAVSANLGMFFPVELVATDILSATPNLELRLSTNAGEVTRAVIFTTTVGQVTWNGTVQIPITAVPYTIATLNLMVPYIDKAGNTNNVLLGRVTVAIDEAIPYIVSVNFDNILAYPDMIVSARPFTSVAVVDYQAVGLDPHSVRVTVDGELVYSGPVVFSMVAATPFPTYTFDFAYPQDLSNGSHDFSFGLSDQGGNAAVPYLVTVRVFSQDVDLIHDPVPYPNPFSPNNDGVKDTTQIVYQLTSPTDVSIYIYDLNGDMVWKQFIVKGLEGAHAGINRVPWDGKASFEDTVLPNGLYICHVIIEEHGQKKTLGRTKIYILK